MAERAVIVGVGQVRRKAGLDVPEESWTPVEPVDLVAEALARAAADAGRPELLAEADAIGWVPALSWGYEDAPTRLAEALGRPPAASGWACNPGGDGGVQVVNDAANRIAAGELKIALVGGCEVLHGRRRAMAQGIDLDTVWTPGGGDVRHIIGAGKSFSTEGERLHGIDRPTSAYPLLENALRAEAGRSIEAHQHYLGELYARYSEVAAANPYTWFPGARSADDIREVHAQNRFVGFPYPKNMNAIMEVDQGAAAIVMAACEADRLGIPEERRVAFLGGGRSVDGWSVSVRASLSRSPAYEAAAAEAAGHAGVGPQAVDVFDLYSCFPSAVELAMKALGVAAGDPRPLTCTGGLAHHGGPGNAYSLHGVANMVDTLRNGPGRVGWVSGLGMTATKHAICVLTSDPARQPASDGRATEVALSDALRDGPECVAQPDGNAEVESYTVLFGRDNEPNRSVFLLRLEDGRRALANGEAEREALLQLTREEGVGLRGKVHAGGEGTPNTFTPS